MIAQRKLRAVDLFCGAGGMTLGAVQSGRIDVVLAVNHWRTACLTHAANHPATRHICARIEDMSLRDEHDLPEVDVIMGGIECVYHSDARGSAPINDQKRSSAWRTLDWIARFRPQWCVFENVREFLDWGPIDDNCRKIKSRKGEIFNAWIAAIRAHGYHVEWKLLNASHYGEATRRRRLFIVCRRGGSDEPFKWPEPTHGSREEIYRTLAERHRCNYLHERPAAEIIDWSRECPSIFSRKRPLAEKTLRRIEAGLRKFVEPYLVQLRGTGTTASIHNPLGTVTAGGTHWGVATPFISAFHNGDNWDRNYSPNEPLRTLDTQNRYAVTMPLVFHQGSRCEGRTVDRPLHTIMARNASWMALPFMVPRHGEASGQHPRTHDVRHPFPVLTASNNPSLVMPYLMDVNHGGADARCYSPFAPMNTITAKKGQALVHPFITKFYGTGTAVPVTRPLDTVTAKHRHGLTLVKTMQELGIVDIGFRMLDVDELAAAQGFPPDYELHGNKADQVRQIGNAVCPGVMRAIAGQLS